MIDSLTRVGPEDGDGKVHLLVHKDTHEIHATGYFPAGSPDPDLRLEIVDLTPADLTVPGRKYWIAGKLRVEEPEAIVASMPQAAPEIDLGEEIDKIKTMADVKRFLKKVYGVKS